ncbi:MAG: hypothetical protein L0Y38_08955 [Methylococcaceae bacterium]|nr:hypothetical protein [Methylococcaceae bacterium]MCI0667720.1 hypothetical protein [Methylococcaceae bacterium]MCI0733934.1 hypothetical protein [Methylococcaceae bacterium]
MSAAQFAGTLFHQALDAGRAAAYRKQKGSEPGLQARAGGRRGISVARCRGMRAISKKAREQENRMTYFIDLKCSMAWLSCQSRPIESRQPLHRAAVSKRETFPAGVSIAEILYSRY